MWSNFIDLIHPNDVGWWSCFVLKKDTKTRKITRKSRKTRENGRKCTQIKGTIIWWIFHFSYFTSIDSIWSYELATEAGEKDNPQIKGKFTALIYHIFFRCNAIPGNAWILHKSHTRIGKKKEIRAKKVMMQTNLMKWLKAESKEEERQRLNQIYGDLASSAHRYFYGNVYLQTHLFEAQYLGCPRLQHGAQWGCFFAQSGSGVSSMLVLS